MTQWKPWPPPVGEQVRMRGIGWTATGTWHGHGELRCDVEFIGSGKFPGPEHKREWAEL